MPRFSFENKFTFGNLLQVAVLIIGMIGGWYMLAGSVSANTTAIVGLQNAVKPIESLNVRLTVIESRAAATDEQIRILLGSIDKLVEQMSADRVSSERIRTDVGYLRDWVEALKREARNP